MIPIEEVQAVFTASGIIVFLLACGIYTICLFACRLLLSPLARFPGPKLAAITSWYEVYFDVVLDGRFMWEIDRMHEEYGPIVRINPFEIHIKDPDFYNTLYAGPTKKRDKYFWFLSTGAPTSTFSTADYDHHRLRRGMLNPYLSRAAVRDLESVIQQKVHLLCNHVRSAMEKRAAMELHQCFISLAVDIVSTHAFGMSNGFNLLNAAALDDKWKAGINGSFEKFLLTRHFPWLIRLFRLLPLSISALICPSCRNIHFIETEIESQMDSVYVKNRDGISENGIFPEIMNNEKLPVAERMLPRLVDDAKLLMVAGTDAPSQVLAITMFHILHHQSVYRKFQGELEDNIPNPQGIPPLRVLERLPYLTAIIKEGLRISAVVTSRLPRIVPDEKLKYRGWQIPVGTPVSMSTHFILRDPKIFPDPMAFQPERWMGESSSNLEKYLVPFSKGSQACLGPNMTYAWCYLTFATLFRRFEFSLFETTEENVGIIRDCFNGQTKPGYNNIQVEVLKEVKPISNTV